MSRLDAEQASPFNDHLRAIARRIRRTVGFELRRHESVLGYDVAPFRHRARLFAREEIDLVIDVGANIGQYALALRRGGYEGDILSLEPLSAPFSELSQRAARDPRWTCRQLALSDSAGWSDLNVAAHSAGSSFLKISDRLVANTPEMATVGVERVRHERLDYLRDSIESHRTLLKLDVQGFELQILTSGREMLAQLVGLDLEMSFEPLYEGEASVLELTRFLDSSGFRLAAVDPGIPDLQTGFPLQIDGLFLRR